VVAIPCLLRGGTEMQTLQLVKALIGKAERRNQKTEMLKGESGNQEVERLKIRNAELLKTEDGGRETEEGGNDEKRKFRNAEMLKTRAKEEREEAGGRQPGAGISAFQRLSVSAFDHVSVVCYFESDPEVVAEFQAAKAEVRLLNLERTLPAWRLVKRLRQEFRALKPDVVHIQYMAPGFLAVLAARLAGCQRVLATVHQPWTQENHGWKGRFLLRAATRLCTRFICVSEAAERSWFGSSHLYSSPSTFNLQPSTLPRRHITIHNAIDLERIDSILSRTNRQQVRDEFGLGDGLVVGAVSRLRHEKGIDVLLEAWALVVEKLKTERRKDQTEMEPQRRRDAEKPSSETGSGSLSISTFSFQLSVFSGPPPVLLIVGDGEDRAKLKSRAAQLGLEQLAAAQSSLDSLQVSGLKSQHSPLCPRILWAGQQSWQRCIELMSVMDIVVVPSRFEGFGLTAAEAMACGKPVVGSDVGGLPEVLGTDGVAGVLFPASDTARLADALLELAGSPARRVDLGLRGRRRVTERFSFAQFESRTQALYRDLLAE